MKLQHLLFAILALGAASPAMAERMEFDFRLYPSLRQVIDGGDRDMIDYNADNPARVVDVIAIKGRSAQDWTEALEIISLKKPVRPAVLSGWMDSIARQAAERCPAATRSIVTQDTNSITFETRAPGCADKAAFGTYRLIAGKRSWFQLAVVARDEPAPAARDQWLALLGSAHLTN